jgi:glutathione S-transferase
MKVIVYGGIHWDRSGKIRWLLEELGVKHDDHWLDVEKGDRESASYLKVNPLGRIPAVTFDGVPMIESGAICAYLTDRYLGKGLAPALDSELRKSYQQWMYLAVTVDSFSSRLSIIEDIPAGEVLDQKMGAYITEVKDYVDFLGASLEKNDYLIGEFSTADICVGYHLYIASLWPELNDIFESNKNVSAYLKRLKARQAAKTSKVFSYEA